jgi:endonuclease/exonuclease/phosphatase family metal-dependent hydrolase
VKKLMGTKKMTKNEFSFMTWNLYLGADLTPILSATPSQIPQRITEVLKQFLATNFHFRVRAIARQIASKKPDLIGLQEVERFQLNVPNMPIVTYDYLILLVNELRKLGFHYDVAAQNVNFTIDLPISLGNTLKFCDRDVILIRKESDIKVIRVQEANFKTNLHLQIAGQPFEIVRGWSFADIRSNKRIFRVINTHLEPDSSIIQVAQADEILQGPAKTNLPLVVLGDLNSNADGTGTPTYNNFIRSDFMDVWKEVARGPGYTCCQEANLLNPASSLDSRIDFILYKNGWKPIKANLVGNKQSDRTLSGLWPSDHAGVVASLILL